MSQDCLSWFAARKISLETLLRNRVTEEHLQMSKKHSEKENAIVFPYLLHGKVTNTKLRTLGRRFAFKRQHQSIWYGLDDIVNQDTIIIVEGEMDKLSMEEAGFTNVVSVPHGAPQVVKQGPLPEPSKDKAFAYVWNCWPALERAACIMLATDDDVPGHALSEKLARRLGRDRCLRVLWAAPGATSAAPSKDANDVLVQRGPLGVQHCIHQAKPLSNRMQYTMAAS
ncbi:hypothetical protein ABBQ32_009487 [Trebouxia sp. C0010 RCD-2024]